MKKSTKKLTYKKASEQLCKMVLSGDPASNQQNAYIILNILARVICSMDGPKPVLECVKESIHEAQAMKKHQGSK